MDFIQEADEIQIRNILKADKAYEHTMHEQAPFTCDEIRAKTMPIDLYKAYWSYHYGIYDRSTNA
ncbi:MAG: hypothetical protein PUC12_12605 [Clostridiales bacterium]|nr:hypothetical protein [Clostridiales bacterium]